jgi:hypothetical protein
MARAGRERGMRWGAAEAANGVGDGDSAARGHPRAAREIRCADCADCAQCAQYAQNAHCVSDYLVRISWPATQRACQSPIVYHSLQLGADGVPLRARAMAPGCRMAP